LAKIKENCEKTGEFNLVTIGMIRSKGWKTGIRLENISQLLPFIYMMINLLVRFVRADLFKGEKPESLTQKSILPWLRWTS
jgi:hypothetical protein